MPVCVWTDSSAAIWISTRSGRGQLRHLETHIFWVQKKFRVGAIAVRKVRGDVHPADLFAKHLPSKDKIHQLTFLFGRECRSGRAACAPFLRLHDVGGQKDGHLPDDNVLPNFNVYEADLHNEKRLPHQYEPDYIRRAIPRLEAAASQPNLGHRGMGARARNNQACSLER